MENKKLCAKECSKRHIFLSHFFIFHHKPKRMLKCLRNGFWIVIVQKIRKKCLSHSGKMHFSVSGHVTLGVVRWRHELDYICPLWVLSKFGPIEAYRCRVIANWFFPSNGIKRYFNEPLKQRFLSLSLILWYKTNRMWLSVVCILIDNDTGHHSRQDLLWHHWFIHACRHKQNLRRLERVFSYTRAHNLHTP